MTAPQAQLSQAEQHVGEGYAAGAWFFLFVAVILAGMGIYRMTHYDEADKLVGGDAYNYTILATRGVGFICAGVVSAVTAATFAIMNVSAQLIAIRMSRVATSASAPNPANVATVPNAARAPGHILCWNCGKEYDIGLTSCPHCGKKIAMSPIYRP